MNCTSTKHGNILAIGDNLYALQRLVKTKNIFDFIYIDPPYNTGNSFSYLDKRDEQQYESFMSKRLALSHRILSDDGLIYISIDDSSYVSLRTTCDKIFGKDNFVGTLITHQAIRSNTKLINTVHEYIIVYAKNIKQVNCLQVKRSQTPEGHELIDKLNKLVQKTFLKCGRPQAEKALRSYIKLHATSNNAWLRNYNCVDEQGRILFPKDLSVPGDPAPIDIDEINLHLAALPTRRWSSKKKFIKLHNEGKLYFKNGRPYEAHYLLDSYDNVSSILNFYSRQGTNDLVKLGLRGLFDTPKPVELIKYLIRISLSSKDNAKILDFFAGSGTTGQAVMEVNKEDDKHHIFCLVQLDEPISEKTSSYRYCIDQGLPPTIDQLTKMRLDRYIDISKSTEKFSVIKVEEI